MTCTQTCNQGRSCTCGQITPATYRWIVRDTRRGEKTRDQQRRLERYREQRPGG